MFEKLTTPKAINAIGTTVCVIGMFGLVWVWYQSTKIVGDVSWIQ